MLINPNNLQYYGMNVKYNIVSYELFHVIFKDSSFMMELYTHDTVIFTDLFTL